MKGTLNKISPRSIGLPKRAISLSTLDQRGTNSAARGCQLSRHLDSLAPFWPQTLSQTTIILPFELTRDNCNRPACDYFKSALTVALGRVTAAKKAAKEKG